MKHHTSLSIRLISLVILVGSLLANPNGAGTAAADGRMDYHDTAELEAALQDLADGSPHAQLFSIGYSLDFKTDPGSPAMYPIYAIRISASTDEKVENDRLKNGILFEGGMHPREWLTTESLLSLADYLVRNAEEEHSGVPELLAGADVWIIPLSNPSGRVIDDTHGGDPRYFSTHPESAGWRGNGDIQGGCDYGVNVARNFSAGWRRVNSQNCTDDRDGTGDDPPDGKNSDPVENYRGFAPFSTIEATSLRNFVENHSISMAVVVHANAQQIWNLWGTGDVAGASIVKWATFGWNFNLDDARLVLTKTPVGGGMGQFSGWLSSRSDTPYQPDTGTMRSIQTIFIELPFLSKYYGGDYRAPDDDGSRDSSNGFHPSGAHVRDLITFDFLPMATALIMAAVSPGCPELGSCPTRDFGLVGATIGSSSTTGVGALTTNPAGCLGNLENGLCTGQVVPARDYLSLGKKYVYFRAQNFSSQAGYDDLDVRMTVIKTVSRPDGSMSSISRSTQSFRNLSKRAAVSGFFELNIDQAGADYEVTLEVRPRGGFTTGARDGFSLNNKKVFKFRAE